MFPTHKNIVFFIQLIHHSTISSKFEVNSLFVQYKKEKS